MKRLGHGGEGHGRSGGEGKRKESEPQLKRGVGRMLTTATKREADDAGKRKALCDRFRRCRKSGRVGGDECRVPSREGKGSQGLRLRRDWLSQSEHKEI